MSSQSIELPQVSHNCVYKYDFLSSRPFCTLSQQIVPEDLRPVLTSQVQLESDRRVHHRLDSPARVDPPSSSCRPAQEASLACTEQSPRPAARPSQPSSPLVQLTKVNPVTFSPMSNISPIKRQEYHWSLSDQLGSKAGGVSVARVEKIAASDQTLKVEENDVLKELFPNDINSPTGITATCRRPIKGASRRPVKSSDLWNDENYVFSPKATKTTSSSSYTESCTVNRVTSLPPSCPSYTSSTSSNSTSTSSSRLLSAALPAGQTKAAYRSVSLWIKLFLLAIVAAFLFLVYQAMETNTINPFTAPDTEVASGSTA